MAKNSVRVRHIEITRKSIKPGLQIVVHEYVSKKLVIATIEAVDWVFDKGSPFDNGMVTLQVLLPKIGGGNVLCGFSYRKGNTIPALLDEKGKVVIKDLEIIKMQPPRPAIRYKDKIKEEEPESEEEEKKPILKKKKKKSGLSLEKIDKEIRDEKPSKKDKLIKNKLSSRDKNGEPEKVGKMTFSERVKARKKELRR